MASVVGSTDTVVERSFNSFAFAIQKVALLVDDDNFLAWKYHVMLVFKTHRLLPFVEGTISVLSQSLVGDGGVSIENLEYVRYEQ